MCPNAIIQLNCLCTPAKETLPAVRLAQFFCQKSCRVLRALPGTDSFGQQVTSTWWSHCSYATEGHFCSEYLSNIRCLHSTQMSGCDFIPKAPPAQELHLQSSYCNYNYDTNQALNSNHNSIVTGAPTLQTCSCWNTKHLRCISQWTRNTAEFRAQRRSCTDLAVRVEGQTGDSVRVRILQDRHGLDTVGIPDANVGILPNLPCGYQRFIRMNCKAANNTLQVITHFRNDHSSRLQNSVDSSIYLKCFAETDMVSAEYNLSCNNILTRKRKSIIGEFLNTFDWHADWTQTWILVFHRFVMDDFLLIILFCTSAQIFWNMDQRLNNDIVQYEKYTQEILSFSNV